MSLKSIMRSVRWTVRPDPEQGGVDRIVYDAECLTCGATSDVAHGSRVGPEVWTLTHTGANPSHRQYAASSHTVWRVFLTDGDVADLPADKE
ncbi:hypothetical protein [Streptomyces sp. NPDC056672]|uniref:DUF7848 domain-containing protein n=1 Tax=Streptomyces sp. NPDC056672 TaxID=3345906 RepID=UPI0036C7800D